MTMMFLVRYNHHLRIILCPLHLFFSWTIFHSSALIISPETNKHNQELLNIPLTLTIVKNKSWFTNLGYGDPFINFWPYFFHKYPSFGISAILSLIASTLTVLVILFFLKFKLKQISQPRCASIAKIHLIYKLNGK
jgi:hypothetical protein